MFTKVKRIRFVLPLLVISLSCAPGVENEYSDDPADDIENPNKAPAPIPIPAGHKDRIDTVLKHVRQRDLFPDHAFWTIFHGILGVGPDDAMILDPVTKKRTKAIDYLASGGEVNGLEFTPTADGVEVVTMPGSIIGQGHQDQFVAEMAEWDLPRDIPWS